jgi:hypothetical protein
LERFFGLVVDLRGEPANGESATDEEGQREPKIQSVEQRRLGLEASQQLNANEVQIAEERDEHCPAIEDVSAVDQVHRHLVSAPHLVPKLRRLDPMRFINFPVDARKLLRQQNADDDQVDVNEVPRERTAGEKISHSAPRHSSNEASPVDVDGLRKQAKVNVELKHRKKVCE